MLIIKEGVIPTREICHRKKCRKCKTEFAYTEEDIITVAMMLEDVIDYVECPVCGKHIRPSIFDKKIVVEVPERLKKQW